MISSVLQGTEQDATTTGEDLWMIAGAILLLRATVAFAHIYKQIIIKFII